MWVICFCFHLAVRSINAYSMNRPTVLSRLDAANVPLCALWKPYFLKYSSEDWKWNECLARLKKYFIDDHNSRPLDTRRRDRKSSSSWSSSPHIQRLAHGHRDWRLHPLLCSLGSYPISSEIFYILVWVTYFYLIVSGKKFLILMKKDVIVFFCQ